MRYRGSSSNNPNLMYRDECDRRMRPGGGSSSSKDGFSRDNRNSRDDDRPSSSYRDRSRDHRNSFNSGSEQYQSYGSASGGYNSHGGGGGQDHSQFCQPPLLPPTGGLQPLMAQQFAPQQPPLMSFVGQTPYTFASPPPPPPGVQPPGT